MDMRYQIESNILSCVLNDFSYADKVLAQLKVTDFKDEEYQNLFKLIQQLVKEGKTEFSITEVQAIHPKFFKYVSFETITDLYDVVINTPNYMEQELKHSIPALIYYSTIDSIINLTNSLPKLVEDNGNEKAINIFKENLEGILSRVNRKESVNLYDEFHNKLFSDEKIDNVDLGFKVLHDTLGYPHPGELMIVGARPAMGKTAFALACLFNYIHSGSNKKAIMFSLEMSGEELFQRMLSSVSNIPLQAIRAGGLPQDAKDILDSNAKELASNPNLILYDNTVSNIPALKAAIKKENKKGQVGLIIVDYLQLLSGEGNSNYEKVSEISRQLKLIAREFNCTVIALSQLSRKVEERADKRPQLSDLRESGAIEQDADYVLFLYRHNYYEKDPSVDPHNEIINIEVAKNRHGKSGTVQLEVDLTCGRFKGGTDDEC
ncbi:MAG: AAA family ATPase [Acholeplasmatales bacterium]|nr:AAA family ATPase [Acholeplasmatales bacterium]